jgi:hypothetical protein
MLSSSLFFVGFIACLLILIIYWILSYYPIRINWHFATQAFLAGASVGFIGFIICLFEGVNWLFSLIF